MGAYQSPGESLGLHSTGIHSVAETLAVMKIKRRNVTAIYVIGLYTKS